LLLGGAYLAGLRRLAGLSRRAESGGPSRAGFFLTGYLALLLALVSPIHAFAEDLFSMHMVQHLLLTSVAAPLLMLANPMPALIWSLPADARAAAGRLMSGESWLLGALKLLTRPLVAWWLFLLDLWVWHQPAAYQAALANEAFHHAQHLLFFFGAVLFWWPVIGPAPLRTRLRYPARLLYVFLAWLPNSILGAGFTFAPAVLMSFYESRPRHWGADPLTDQQIAGLIMWVPGDAIYAAALMVLLLAILRQEDAIETMDGGR
jgi:cytochrome c oxidase assembly factor CtaG